MAAVFARTIHRNSSSRNPPLESWFWNRRCLRHEGLVSQSLIDGSFLVTSPFDIVCAVHPVDVGSNQTDKSGGQIDAYHHYSQRIDRTGAVRACRPELGGGRRDGHLQGLPRFEK